MASHSGDRGPALLQLSKWEPSPVLNFADFHEAFLSPTRELILLLSCHSEALLLPLVAGERKKSCNSVLLDLTTSHFSEPHLCKINSGDNGSYNSDSFTMKCLDECTRKHSFLVSDSHCFISDVNSVAWAASDDAHISNEDCTYKEFLFVSGNHGVTIHAFRQSVETNKMTESCLEVEREQGTWVDWGPSTTLAQETKFSVCLEEEARVIKKSEETMDQYLSEDGNGGSSGNSTPKRWLQSFLSEVETMKSEKNVWTKLPDQSSFPCYANIVSFTIFKRKSLSTSVSQGDPSVNIFDTMEETSPLADAHFRSGMGSSSPISKTDVLSYLLDNGMNTPYECSRVIPSHQINSIGFLLTLVDHSSAIAGNGSGRNLSSNLLLVARLHHWGIQWLCCVHLDESQDLDDMVGWADFQLSRDFVACLKASGLIFLYGISTGEYVTHIDILPACGFSRLSNDQKLDASEGLDMEKGSSCKIRKNNLGGFSSRIFKKFIFASHPSLIAAVDESGIVYVMRLCDLLPHNINLSDSMLSHLLISKFGLLAGWKVAGTDLSCQKIFPDLSDLHTTKFPTLRNKLSDYPLNENQCELGLGGFSTATHKQESHAMRKVFLPSEKFSELDHISVSPFGVTRLIKRQNITGKNSLKIVHTSFQLNSVADNVEFCDSKFKIFQGGEGTATDEAVVCVFQGCLYLLARDGLLVVLPNISLSPSFLPVEQMSSMLLSVNRDIQSQNTKLIGTDEPLSQWKIEVLDRVLIYECPEEGDRLCLRNGENPLLIVVHC